MNQCSICYVKNKLFEVCECRHRFCRSCMKSYLKYHLNNGEIRISCPFWGCKESVKNSKKLFGDYLYRRYLNYQLKYFQCPNIGCTQYIPIKGIQCDGCHTIICDKCFHTHSAEGDCEDVDELKTRIYKTINYIRCPLCKSHIERDEGCENVKCKICKTKFNEDIYKRRKISSYENDEPAKFSDKEKRMARYLKGDKKLMWYYYTNKIYQNIGNIIFNLFILLALIFVLVFVLALFYSITIGNLNIDFNKNILQEIENVTIWKREYIDTAISNISDQSPIKREIIRHVEACRRLEIHVQFTWYCLYYFLTSPYYIVKYLLSIIPMIM